MEAKSFWRNLDERDRLSRTIKRGEKKVAADKMRLQKLEEQFFTLLRSNSQK